MRGYIIGIVSGVILTCAIGMTVKKAITKCEECAKDEKSIASDLMKGNDDEHNN